MSKFINNLYDSSSKDILINNLAQNNYYKEVKNSNNNSKTRSDSQSKKTKYNSKSKTKYKVVYSNSFLDNNVNQTKSKNKENKNALVINSKLNNSNNKIKEINNYNNKKNNKNISNITNDNFYTKKMNEILNTDNYNLKNNNKRNNNIINLSLENNNLNLINKTHSTIHNTSINNINNYSHKNKSKIKNIKKSSSKKKVQRIIYAKYADKKTFLPFSNIYKNNIIIKRNISKKKEDKDINSKNSKTKYSLIQYNKKSNNYQNNNFINLHYFSNFDNNKNLYKKNFVSIPLKQKVLSNQKKNYTKEIKKCQSQSYFKNKLNNDINTSNYKYNPNNINRSKNKIKINMSYIGFTITKNNPSKNIIAKSSSYKSTSKNNKKLCLYYKSKYNTSSIKKSNKKLNANYNYNYLMQNLPIEYNKDTLFLEIKKLWKKLNVSYLYQEKFIILTLQNENRKQMFVNEINNLSLILNYLNKINEDIKKRNEIINKIKSFNNYNDIEELKKLLNSLRIISIDVIFDYMLFIKEISYSLMINKLNLEDIKDFNRDYLNVMKNDTNFLYYHNNLNKIFNFNKTNDPFLLNPSSEKQKNNSEKKYEVLSINEEILEKINKCEYFLLTEEICQCSKNKNKFNINNLLLNDKDININNIINNDTINKSISNNPNNNIIINSYSSINKKENNSQFSTPIIKNNNDINNNKESNDDSKYNKFCYINDINNKINNTKNNEEENIKVKEEDNNLYSNNLNTKINIKNNDNNSEINIDLASDKNNSVIDNSNEMNTSPIKGKIELENVILNENNKLDEIKIIPYIPLKESSLSTIYSSYLSNVPENIKQSFNINEDIFYYANIGIYPKIIFFKDSKNLNIKGICTISFSHNINPEMSLNKKILIVTSISCQKGEKISNILINLIEFCRNEEIIFDSIEVNLYYIKKNGNFILDNVLEKEIKSEAKFKWVRLENDGEKRKIKYHYIPNNIIINKENSIFNNNINMNSFDMNYNKCSIYINNFVLIKFYQEQGINEISMVEYSKLYFIIKLLNKYFLLNENNNNKDIENILINLKGLKLKKIVRILSEYNSVLLTNISDFKNDYLCNDNYNMELLNSFLDIMEKNQNEEENNNGANNICLDFNNICTNFSNIIKVDINGYEYNVISMNDFIIEEFSISNEDNKNNNNEFIYFTKSEIENISFIFYEQNENINNTDENYMKILFNKILKKILIKDNEEPIKSYKKIGIPSFCYQEKAKNEKSEKSENKLKIIEYDMLECNESFDFCIENIPNYNTKFSFPLNENSFEKQEIKIIKNNFVVAVLNSDLVLDYHLPSMNIYYINKDFWIKTNNK